MSALLANGAVSFIGLGRRFKINKNGVLFDRNLENELGGTLPNMAS